MSRNNARARKGKTTPDEVKAKISDALRGRPKSEEHKANMRKPKSKEYRANISAAMKKRRKNNG